MEGLREAEFVPLPAYHDILERGGKMACCPRLFFAPVVILHAGD
jgi:hypothetical protein